MYTLNVPPYSEYWPEDILVKPKHVAKTVYYWLYIDVVLRMNIPLYWILNNTRDGSCQNVIDVFDLNIYIYIYVYIYYYFSIL